MAIYEIGETELRLVEGKSFRSVGLRERTDLQRLLRDHIEAVSPDTLVIAEEFGEWTDSRRRIDLLGIDKEANLVVIELKRTDDGGHMELQAVRYAAMVSTLVSQRAVEIFSRYLESRGFDDDAEQRLLEFLEWDEVDEDRFAQDVRLVLVSADFSRELTTAVMWLNEKDLDIRCVRIRPYIYDGKTLIDVQQVIPLPEAADYQVQVREKMGQERKARRSTIDFTAVNPPCWASKTAVGLNLTIPSRGRISGRPINHTLPGLGPCRMTRSEALREDYAVHGGDARHVCGSPSDPPRG